VNVSVLHNSEFALSVVQKILFIYFMSTLQVNNPFNLQNKLLEVTIFKKHINIFNHVLENKIFWNIIDIECKTLLPLTLIMFNQLFIHEQ